MADKRSKDDQANDRNKRPMVEFIGDRVDDTGGAPGTGTTRDDIEGIAGSSLPPKSDRQATAGPAPDLMGVSDLSNYSPKPGKEPEPQTSGRPPRNDAPALGATGEGNRPGQTGGATVLSDDARRDQNKRQS